MNPTNNQLSNAVIYWDLQFQNKLNSEALVEDCLPGVGKWAKANDTPDLGLPPLDETMEESDDSNAELMQTSSSVFGLNGNGNHAAGHSEYTNEINTPTGRPLPGSLQPEAPPAATIVNDQSLSHSGVGNTPSTVFIATPTSTTYGSNSTRSN